MSENKPPSNIVIILATITLVTGFAVIIMITGAYAYILDPNLITDKNIHPANTPLGGIVTILHEPGEYCINAETLSRGEPVDIGLHYIIQEPTTADRFGSTRNTQRGVVFTADNNKIVNETVTVPEGATDVIITVDYSGYSGDNDVHVRIRKC